jgi:hypothetical protein
MVPPIRESEMQRLNMPMAIAVIVQLAFAAAMWLWLVEDRPWNIVQQFWGHYGPSIFLVALGAVAILERGGPVSLGLKDAWLAIIAGGAYILADTFIMHPPFGVFDGAGNAEQEHVSIMAMILMLGVSCLVMLRRFGTEAPLTIYFVVGITVASLVFLSHHQHTQAGAVAHNATIIFLAVAALLRLLGRQMEYGVAMVVAGWVFFCSQMGFAHYVDMTGHSAGAWIALWAMFGFTSATVFMLFAEKPRDAIA